MTRDRQPRFVATGRGSNERLEVLREGRFNTGTVEINYGEGPPNGPPFVILHGGSASWRYAEALIELLVDQWHVFAPDFRGHGESGRVAGHYNLRDYAEDIADFLVEVVRDEAVLFGHSLGGEVAIMVAAEHPGNVCAVIHGDVSFSKVNHPTAENNVLRAQNELWYRLSGQPVADIAMELREMMVSVPGTDSPVRAGDAFGEANPWFDFQALNLHRLDPGMLAAVLAGPEVMLDGYEPEKLLPAISCPVLILQADPDAGGGMSDAEVEKGMRLLPRPTLVRLEGIGHELHGLHAQRIFDVMSQFLKDHASHDVPARTR
ncbi:MAG: alpha/beta fold hydrolase [Thermomicrobiales bacterium]